MHTKPAGTRYLIPVVPNSVPVRSTVGRIQDIQNSVLRSVHLYLFFQNWRNTLGCRVKSLFLHLLMPSPCAFITCCRQHMSTCQSSRHFAPLPVACRLPTSQVPRRGAISRLLHSAHTHTQVVQENIISHSCHSSTPYVKKDIVIAVSSSFSVCVLPSSLVLIMPLPSVLSVNFFHCIPNPNANT